MSAELDGDELASMQAAANDELFELAERLFTRDYSASNADHRSSAAHAMLAAEAFLDHRDELRNAVAKQEAARARRAAKRAQSKAGAA